MDKDHSSEELSPTETKKMESKVENPSSSEDKVQLDVSGSKSVFQPATSQSGDKIDIKPEELAKKKLAQALAMRDRRESALIDFCKELGIEEKFIDEEIITSRADIVIRHYIQHSISKKKVKPSTEEIQSVAMKILAFQKNQYESEKRAKKSGEKPVTVGKVSKGGIVEAEEEEFAVHEESETEEEKECECDATCSSCKAQTSPSNEDLSEDDFILFGKHTFQEQFDNFLESLRCSVIVPAKKYIGLALKYKMPLQTPILTIDNIHEFANLLKMLPMRPPEPVQKQMIGKIENMLTTIKKQKRGQVMFSLRKSLCFINYPPKEMEEIVAKRNVSDIKGLIKWLFIIVTIIVIIISVGISIGPKLQIETHIPYREPSIDLYGMLYLEPEASEQDIRSAYRKLARKFHPDRNPDCPDCEERMGELAQAQSILLDKDRRRYYDMYGTDMPKYLQMRLRMERKGIRPVRAIKLDDKWAQ
ncbi:hypothetical protein ADUPG1_008133 [Aduncisulcus paluster]|uniref:J domain-containing protein n=1 Tax=Aduncisulcus paluster TaxID=2918883 RepID=A0ABQ5KTZ1_9EUKA|nr:hypothetical protein ADUPG1_008133 [Aduncisulcus paluster]